MKLPKEADKAIEKIKRTNEEAKKGINEPSLLNLARKNILKVTAAIFEKDHSSEVDFVLDESKVTSSYPSYRKGKKEFLEALGSLFKAASIRGEFERNLLIAKTCQAKETHEEVFCNVAISDLFQIKLPKVKGLRFEENGELIDYEVVSVSLNVHGIDCISYECKIVEARKDPLSDL